MQIILIGMMFSGKTTVGESLAKCLNMEHFDSDKIIEKHHGAISTIFKNYGESYFRDLEENAIEYILKMHPNCVLSTGGGCIIREKTRNALKNKIVIFLQTSLQELQKRATIDNLIQYSADIQQRPLLQKLEKLYYERESLYYETANFIVPTDNKNITDVAKEIKKIIEEIICQQY